MRVMSSTEAWVGTWRPHRPRGPIAALYGSPGPKYALPGLTGTSKHDPTKYKAPVFSFGIRHNHATSVDCSPGPKYHFPTSITRKGQYSTPAFSLRSRPQEQRLIQTPGPGKYSPELSGKLIFRSCPAFSLSGRSKDSSKSQTPGPNSYTLPPMLGPKNAVLPGAPSFSISGQSKTRSFLQDLAKSPGPAAYKVVDPCTYQEKPPQVCMKGRNFPPGDTTQKPGPGAHYPELVTITKAKASSFSFGLHHSQYISPLIVDVPE